MLTKALARRAQAMITDWKDKFNGGQTPIAGRDRPFLFVELAPYTEGVGEPFDQSVSLVRDAQLSALALPAVGMAAAYDFGDTASPLGNIHPRYKAPVGLRLSLAARALAYGASKVARFVARARARLGPQPSVPGGFLADQDLLASDTVTRTRKRNALIGGQILLHSENRARSVSSPPRGARPRVSAIATGAPPPPRAPPAPNKNVTCGRYVVCEKGGRGRRALRAVQQR